MTTKVHTSPFMRCWHIEGEVNLPDSEVPFQHSYWTKQQLLDGLSAILDRDDYTSIVLTLVPGANRE